MAWLSGYTYRQKVTVDGSSDGSLTNYPLQLSVHPGSGSSSSSDVYLENHSLNYPNDINFTSSDGTTKLPYWIEDVQGFATGGAEQPNNPIAIYYNGRTYVCYQGTDLNPYVTYYDSTSSTWATPVQVGTNPLTNDTHGSPSMAIDSSGYIYIFYGCHTTACYVAKSTNPEDISTWTAMPNVGSAVTYPRPVIVSSGDIYLFYRSGSGSSLPEAYVVSSDGGSTWGSEQTLVDFSDSGSYLIYSGNFELVSGSPEQIAFTWHYADSGDTWRRNVYYAILDVTGGSAGHAFGPDGTDLGTTITAAEANTYCLVVNSSTYNTSTPKVHIYSGTPYVNYGYNSNIYLASWNGSSWDATTELATGYTGSSGTFFVNSASDIDAYARGSTGAVDQMHWNGSGWSVQQTVMQSNPMPLGIQDVVNGQSDFKIILSQYGIRTVSVSNPNDHLSCALYGWGSGGFVGSTYATVWAQLDSVPVSPGTADFYIYYGDSDGSDIGSGSGTFEQFDDFEWGANGDSLGNSGGGIAWTATTGTAYAEIDTTNYFTVNQGAQLHTDGTTNAQAHFVQSASDNAFAVRFRLFSPSASQCRMTYSNGTYHIYTEVKPDGSVHWNDGTDHNSGTTPDATVWHLFEFTNINFTAGTYDLWVDGALVLNGVAMASGGTSDVWDFLNMGDGTASSWYMDNVIVRNWTVNDPTWGTWASEETVPFSPGPARGGLAAKMMHERWI